MGIKKTIFDATSNAVIRGLGLNHANKVVCKFFEKVEPTYTVRWESKSIELTCPNDLTLWRARTFFEKEPETIEWINSFKPGEILFDIGANVGLYTLYAAKHGVQVFAFEPESQNYAILNKNLFLNQLQDRVTALNIAFSDKPGIDYLYLPQFQGGGALNNLGEARDYKHESFNSVYRQGVMAFSLDSFTTQNPDWFPAHLKIDVDGIEEKIIHGAANTLKDSRLKSLLIELNEALPRDVELLKTIESSGLKLIEKRQSPMAAVGHFSTIHNFIFRR